MSQTEPAHTRGAIIADLACVVAEISDLQVAQAKISERTAVLQSRLSQMIRDLSCTTALQVPPGTDLRQFRERLSGVRSRLEATADTIKDSAARSAPAAKAAPPSVHPPVTQDEGRPERARKASDEVPVGDVGIGIERAGQSEELRHGAGTGGESAASAGTAPATEMPRVPRREPSIRTAGGGLVQDGGSLLKPHSRSGKERALDLFAEKGLSKGDLAKSLGAPVGSVSGWLSVARKAGDPRIKAGDEKRQARLAADAAKSTRREFADSDKPVAFDRASSSPPLAMLQSDPAPAIPVGMVEIPAGKLIAIRGAEVLGPGGVWRISKETAKAFSLIADGQLYGLETMARHGGLNPKVCESLIGMWTAGLAKIGIELIHQKGFGVRLKAFGGHV